MLPWLFLSFRDKWNGARVILQKCSWNPIYRISGYYNTHGYLMCSKSEHFNAVWSAKPIWPDMTTNTLYVKSLPTPWLDVKKTDLAHAWRFRRTNKKSPLKYPLFGGTLHKICMTCTFRCADTILLRKWLTMDIWKWKIVWPGINGRHVSQEDICK